MAEIKNGAVTITGLEAFERKIEQLKTTNPGFEKRLRDVIRKVLKQARDELSKKAESGLGMKSDPRHAYKAVRYAVYKRIFGGQVNILQSRKAHSPNSYEPPRKLREGQRGGNRRLRSKRTDKVIHYEGLDRGFILRFLEGGTDVRTAKSYGPIGRGSMASWGARGNIAPRSFFHNMSSDMEQAAQQLGETLAGHVEKWIETQFKEE